VLNQPANGSPTTGPSHSERRSTRGSFWATELGLTPAQREQLDRIWSALASRGRDDHDERRREFRRERDDAIADLVPEARLGEYDRIINAYSDRVADLERESREAYEAAVEQTKAILTPQQQSRYEELLRKHRWGPGPVRDRQPSRRAETRATSQPAGEPQQNSSTSHEPLKGAP
jgi:Spy/CpxP family protein refolding chaperone